MPTQNLLRLLLLLMFLRIALAAVCCRFGLTGLVIKLNFCSDFRHKACSGVWSSGKILKLKFGQYFAADIWLRLQSWILVKIMKLGLVKTFCLSEVEMLMFGWDFKVNASSRFRNWSLIKICVELMIWNQPSGPLCLWQCFYSRLNFECFISPIPTNRTEVKKFILRAKKNPYFYFGTILFFYFADNSKQNRG